MGASAIEGIIREWTLVIPIHNFPATDNLEKPISCEISGWYNDVADGGAKIFEIIFFSEDEKREQSVISSDQKFKIFMHDRNFERIINMFRSGHKIGFYYNEKIHNMAYFTEDKNFVEEDG